LCEKKFQSLLQFAKIGKNMESKNITISTKYIILEG